jgi:DNA-directed RNA polymerase specialized sigma24 family protein
VWTALSELPAARRNVVELAYFGGLSYVQIGRAFGVPSAA